MAATPSESVRLFGTEEKVEPPVMLRAGDLTAELEAGNLRYIRWQGAELLRAVSYIVRNKNWGTYNPEISGLKVTQKKDGFAVRYHARCSDAHAAIAYDATIVCGADGTLTFEATATPERALHSAAATAMSAAGSAIFKPPAMLRYTSWPENMMPQRASSTAKIMDKRLES